MRPAQDQKNETAPMTAQQERQAREAQALRANLLRRKQQQRNRPDAGTSSAPPPHQGGR